jgi:stage III sporulation protein AF
MIGAVGSWLRSVAAVTLLLSVVQILIPEGALRRVAGFTGGLLLLAALLQPLRRADFGWLGLDLTEYRAAIEARSAELSASEKEALADIIEARTAAYISDKADALGSPVAVRVETRPGEDGVPLPWSAELEGSRSQALAAWVEGELGIPAERQVWHEGKTGQEIG